MKRLFTLFAIVTLSLILASCAPKNEKQEEVTADTTTYKPIIMEESSEDTTANSTASMATTTDTTNNAVDTTTMVTKPTTQSGYRVQVFATFSEEKADKIANQVRERTTEPVYVEYIAPYYKVRVGDCTTRDEAESLKSNLYGLGYSDAFIAQDTINPK